MAASAPTSRAAMPYDTPGATASGLGRGGSGGGRICGGAL
jgi:hypothetical protein